MLFRSDGKEARAHLMVDRNLARWLKRLRASGPSTRLGDELRRLLLHAPEGAVKNRGRRLQGLIDRARKISARR